MEPAAAPFSVAAAVSGSSQVANDGSSASASETSLLSDINTATTLPAVTALNNTVSAAPVLFRAVTAGALSVATASTAAITAAMGPLAALSSVLEKDKLEEMIQNAVRKVNMNLLKYCNFYRHILRFLYYLVLIFL